MARAAIFRARGAAPSVTSTIFGFRLQLTCPSCSYLKPANLSSVYCVRHWRVPHPRQLPSLCIRSRFLPEWEDKGLKERNGGGSKEILVQHLLVSEDNAKLLLEIQKKIAAGVDLSDLAVEYSICPSKENGGMLGWVRKGQLGFKRVFNISGGIHAYAVNADASIPIY